MKGPTRYIHTFPTIGSIPWIYTLLILKHSVLCTAGELNFLPSSDYETTPPYCQMLNYEKKLLYAVLKYVYFCNWNIEKKLHGRSPRANYTDRATAVCRRSDYQLVQLEYSICVKCS
jgi:hypothetical protein